ncbi:hypothetical protein AXE83_05780 [Streptococcus sp. oral taxon 431]|uniref:DUF6892 domain-containing protein n=2 Tax=Streptococcus TaxID=1301 RepID=UPI000767FFFA|nr:hypothetical protein AXE83_05780 [Streptococcus sp. oral taxon 431]
MFHFFKKKTHKKLEINLQNNSMIINGTSLAFPLSLKDIEAALGKPDQVVKRDNKFIKYIYDNTGIVFEHSFSINNHLKKCKTYIDEEHLISTVFLYYGDFVKSMTGEKELPKQPCQAMVLSDGKSPYFFSDRHRVGDFNLILWTPYGTNFNGIAETITDTLSISYFPEIKHERESYKLKETDEELLHFDNINFKLTIIQVLMYDLRVLKPYFDIYDFAEEFSEEEIDTESIEIIQPALEYMINLPIPKKYAEQVQEIDMDGGNEIYMNLIPQWDGEDETFDLNEVGVEELRQFPNLEEATIMSSNFKQVKAVFDEAGIDVELL